MFTPLAVGYSVTTHPSDSKHFGFRSVMTQQAMEGRVKLPLGRWKFQAHGRTGAWYWRSE